MPARNPGESESSGGGEPRPYEMNISRYAQLFATLCIAISLQLSATIDRYAGDESFQRDDFGPPGYRKLEILISPTRVQFHLLVLHGDLAFGLQRSELNFLRKKDTLNLAKVRKNQAAG